MTVAGAPPNRDRTRYRSSSRSDGPIVTGISSQITLALEEAILLGKLRSGDRIVEAEVAADMGTSNGPVREAFRELEHLGLVMSIPRRGTFVTEFNAQLAREVFSMRALLELSALRLIFPRLNDRDIDRFDAVLADIGRYPGGPVGASRGLVDYDLRFHDITLDLSEHRLLQQAWERLRVQARMLLVVTGALRNNAAKSEAEQSRGLWEVHKPLVDALRSRDLVRCERAFVDHLAEGERKLIDKIAPLEASRPTLVSSLYDGSGSPARLVT
jgi:DNA-binding GntR family transcriptional regulator